MSDIAVQTTHPEPVSAKAAKITALQPVYALVEDDFRAVNDLIPRNLSSNVELVEEISAYIVSNGGKRLRPLMVLLTCGALGYGGRQHIKLAATIEYLHTATLLHDDVVDHSDMRRGKLTANEKWGNAPSILVGDFLYSRAFQLMVDIGSMDIMAVLAAATNTIAEGEVMQLANVGRLDITEAAYREIIRCKTALLFEAASHTGAILTRSTEVALRETQIEAMRAFGLHFGLTYQLVDDWLDYTGDAQTMGKNAGDDLAEGKLTLPLIHALKEAPESDRRIICQAIEAQDIGALNAVLDIVQRCGALQYTEEAAKREAEAALNCLDGLFPNNYVEALQTLTQYSTARLF